MVEGISDEELTAQALAADPDRPLDRNAVPFQDLAAPEPGLLPSWYMPSPVPGQRSARRTMVAALVIVSALVINGLGFCITYGQLTAG
jgi:hypothetical protein